MGASGSRIALDNPFPIDKKINNDLDLLSLVVARVLNTGDIYDIANLGRPGVCGDYAVFLKKQIEKKLLPFVAKIKTKDGEEKDVEVVYQNPRKAIDDSAQQKQICSQLADSAIRVISIIVALLASIQVATPSRETAISSIVQKPTAQAKKTEILTIQAGGGIPEVRNWLVTNGYISATSDSRPGNKVELINPTKDNYRFYISFMKTEGNITRAFLSAEGGREGEEMPTGSLTVQFMNPVPIPGTAKSVLPLRIQDSAGVAWMVGVLYDTVFKSLVSTTPYTSPFTQFYTMFRRTQGWTGEAGYRETRQQLDQANQVFQQARNSTTPHIILQQALSDFFSQYITGFNPAMAGQIQGVPGYPGVAGFPGVPGYPTAPGVPGYPAYGAAPTYGQPTPFGAVTRPLGVPAAPLTAPSYSFRPPQAGTLDYDIPLSASRFINSIMGGFKAMAVKKSCPAAVRAITLAAKVNPDRTIQTGICRDPYWTETSMKGIYPYLTLQFLCIKDWSKLSDATLAGVTFDDEGLWNEFLRGLAKIYDGRGGKLPTLKLPERPAIMIENLNYTGTPDIELCKTTAQNPRVGFQPIQAFLETLQTLYGEHIKQVWAILNELILVIEDPDTRQNIVRLHPAVVKTGTQKYVNDLAIKARRQIIKHYLDVEKAYTDTIVALTKV